MYAPAGVPTQSVKAIIRHDTINDRRTPHLTRKPPNMGSSVHSTFAMLGK